ncbi:D-alanine--D-alanine ligase [Caproiciproducens sp. NJN-50]|uniref:D-alanine--D-alanine ligase family protein n=1 Tax=Acutalibacteraceae TaxID=3082771 RepID=UPI000FFE0C64|nr:MULTISPECIES: D-alanine--D-alanine ligase family protein [Acutalibacteraceae]QAT49211.1 D-alanine--D-alanine ligase [Caproiciproducens sp. NJN-50]
MNRKKIAVLFGGCSPEHEVSRVSAYSVINNLSEDRYEIYRIGITKDGRWFLYEGPTDSIPDGKWEKDERNRPAFLSPDRSVGGIVVVGRDQTEILPVDCVFPVLHGKNGEDGTIQGLLQLSGLPFVGCGTLSSALCMDKAVTHTLLAGVGIRQAQYLWFYYPRYLEHPEKVRIKIGARLGYPVFVKPAGSGSSVGVSRVSSEEELDAAIRLAATEGEKILVEEAVIGQEVECAVLGNDAAEAAPMVGEIAASAAFYDYDDKYKSGKSKLYIPAHLSEEVSEEMRSIAVRAYRTLGCRGFARVDFFVRNHTEILLNELNTIPGFTPISMYPKLWEASGLPYGGLLDRLIDLALEKA